MTDNADIIEPSSYAVENPKIKIHNRAYTLRDSTTLSVLTCPSTLESIVKKDIERLKIQQY